MGKGQPSITNTIRTLRFHAGEMTQAALAEKVGVTRQTIVAIEQGRYSPSLEVAFRIAAAFAVPLDQVFQWAPPDGPAA
ncbi:helix-turn-helix transcriptional regulator [Devosia sp. J2-20]|jgi:putative transcriptional regulator|uniref:Helix-turn-helix transcriptional regulator n=1 Tax=Devosia litorisediminis TaxID=2829817 RepID=A0A942I4S8_9HYPH|nr:MULTISPECIES: helix-turn-helix transcriptional regulator [Devosia]MBS3847791.1 helix-turn-helix transcriptional regulator [Devosia litorisediminis]MCZ4345768.1 helix-turn-helix transcriptional regulator [Devosia neptuniae]WDQ99095.1 helix-turn-helix transcriptional regulator [Devosia sp. J2-20]|tara:strand:- start:2325 stop:2561 length:237 start_codon:yes stop_codon:yes gene_type:complete